MINIGFRKATLTPKCTLSNYSVSIGERYELKKMSDAISYLTLFPIASIAISGRQN